ncbi:Cytochrome P450 monooxygenase TRI13 [Paramyrothecium foliicola]|nr:Cytochrome P450 monooxygenase TRI13 [Paramyrothecium foliicola]
MPVFTALRVHESAFRNVCLMAAVVVAFLTWLYYYLLPKPIRGIPYNSKATASLLGDIPTMTKECNNNAIPWMIKQAQKFSSPLCQLFIIPFGKPIVFLSDFYEAQDILMRRKEFDRADYTIKIMSGAIENHHINLKTGSGWKAHRRLLQDLMTSKFLNNTAGRNIYDSASRLVALWDIKSRGAAGRPFAADKDIYYTAIDSVLDFTFGSSYNDRALPAQIEALQDLDQRETPQGHRTDIPMTFKSSPINSAIVALLQSSEAIGEVSNTPFIPLSWWWKKLQSKEKQFRDTRRKYLHEHTLKATQKFHNAGFNNGEWVNSAVDLIIQRESILAKKENREPIFWSETIHDELLGFVIAGHDTTSTTLCWAVKFLADNMAAQNQLRETLRETHFTAFAEKRSPTYQEIVNASVPYLEAIIEETLRLSHTIPVLQRQCNEDTVILGHAIPKGTIVFMPTSGPSFTEPAFPIDDSLRSESSRNALAERGKRVWSNDNMNVFQPERWLTGSDTKDQTFNGTAGPFLAFGLGKRSCFGLKLAYLEMKLILSLIIWSFELQPCPEELSSYDPDQGLTSMPRECYIRPKRL